MPRRFQSFRRRHLRDLFAPRKPRHRVARVLIGLVGACLLLALIFLGVFVGAAMIVGGLLWKLWKSRGKPQATPRAIVDGQYRVVPRQALPSGR